MSRPDSRLPRVLELRSATGQGGGPEKSILLGAQSAGHGRCEIEICYLLAARAGPFWLADRAAELGLAYSEVRERFALDPRIWTELRQRAQARSIDVVHAHDHKTIVLAWLLSRGLGVAPLATVHGWTGATPRERLLYYPLAKLLLRGFPRVVAVSEPLRRELVGSGVPAERVTTLLNAVDAKAIDISPAARLRARAELGLAADERAIGALGRLARQKRLDLLLRAFAELRHVEARLRLVLVGEGEERARLSELAAQLGLADECRFLGHRPGGSALLPGLDLFVQASDYEGSSNALLEAMAAEVPIVATAVGATADLVKHETHGLLVPPGDPVALAEAMRRALSQRDSARDRARAARRRTVEELGFENRQRRLEAIYAELARSPRRSHTRRRHSSTTAS